MPDRNLPGLPGRRPGRRPGPHRRRRSRVELAAARRIRPARRDIDRRSLNEKVMCALGRGIARTGRLNPDGTELALSNLQRFVVAGARARRRSPRDHRHRGGARGQRRPRLRRRGRAPLRRPGAHHRRGPRRRGCRPPGCWPGFATPTASSPISAAAASSWCASMPLPATPNRRRRSACRSARCA